MEAVTDTLDIDKYRDQYPDDFKVIDALRAATKANLPESRVYRSADAALKFVTTELTSKIFPELGQRKDLASGLTQGEIAAVGMTKVVEEEAMRIGHAQPDIPAAELKGQAEDAIASELGNQVKPEEITPDEEVIIQHIRRDLIIVARRMNSIVAAAQKDPKLAKSLENLRRKGVQGGKYEALELVLNAPPAVA